MTDLSENMSSGAVRKAELLVVDDEAINRAMLEGLLRPEGYAVKEARDGEEALELVLRGKPDCILLDLSMPRLGGVEVCRRLKADASTRMIPILVITANQDSQSRIEAISAGADDFLTKPYVAEEVRMRVRNAVSMKRLYDRAQEDFLRLKSLEETKDTFTHMLIHDLKQPLTAIKAYGELLAIKLGKGGDERSSEVAAKIGASVDSVVSMVSLILDITRLEEGRLPLQVTRTDLNELLRTVTEGNRVIASARGIRIELEEGEGTLSCDQELVERIAQNVLSNSLKYSPNDGTVTVKVVADETNAGFAISDEGAGIPEEYQRVIFEKFGQVEMGKDRKKYSSGLGLAFCKLAAEAHGGTISVESGSGIGTTFTVTLPRR